VTDCPPSQIQRFRLNRRGGGVDEIGVCRTTDSIAKTGGARQQYLFNPGNAMKIPTCALALLTLATLARANDGSPVGTLAAGTAGHVAPTAAPVVTSSADVLCQATEPPARKLGGQIFFRGGGSYLTQGTRGNEVFTDTLGATGRLNNGRAGYSFGFGFHLPLLKDPLFGNTLNGEVLMDYSRFSNNQVILPTSALLGAPRVDTVPVTQFVVAGAPKYQIDGLGRLRPWLIPAGMAMLVNSPPTDRATYLDLGIPFGVGVDYKLTESISLGVDCRYIYNLMRPTASWLTYGGYVGFNF
jgi:hypothetical protein